MLDNRLIARNFRPGDVNPKPQALSSPFDAWSLPGCLLDYGLVYDLRSAPNGDALWIKA